MRLEQNQHAAEVECGDEPEGPINDMTLATFDQPARYGPPSCFSIAWNDVLCSFGECKMSDVVKQEAFGVTRTLTGCYDDRQEHHHRKSAVFQHPTEASIVAASPSFEECLAQLI